ncbi:hypothetical protein [Massilia genomosp. 1]|uniref:DUF3325 domain-containing protein n=1 Tax=Massilia genomosp. 1 TaxID=2609280 RepID=A0ABX0MTZ6_9BURK|nr:hypothetical protein [Massilia genomosp. 1]NHZ64105.1 hypothetical protein [Massilia genomosp. 1]
MIWMSIGAALLAALAFYLASPHQSLWAGAPRRPLRWLALPLCAASVLAASHGYGFWCGVFIALSALMLALVALPCLNAWSRARHVG